MQHVHGVDIYDIYDIVYQPWWRSTWFLLVAMVVVIALAVGAWLLYRKYWRKKALSYEHRVRLQLKALKDSAPEDAHKFYSMLTGVVKEYISQMYGVSAQGLTDDELLQMLKASASIPKIVVDETMKILEGVLVIKFAQGAALKESMNKALESMYKILEQKKKQDD